MYQKILVPVDGSPTSSRGLNEAIELAKLMQARLRLLHVTDDTSMGYAMERYADANDWLRVVRENGASLLNQATAIVNAAGIPVDSVLLDGFSGSVQAFVCAEASSWGADLIVLGTHGRRGLGRAFLGSSAEQVLRDAPVPVLLVRTPELPTRAAAFGHTVQINPPSSALAID